MIILKITKNFSKKIYLKIQIFNKAYLIILKNKSIFKNEIPSKILAKIHLIESKTKTIILSKNVILVIKIN